MFLSTQCFDQFTKNLNNVERVEHCDSAVKRKQLTN